MPVSTSAPVAPQRLFFLDWLRIGAFMLLVPFHVGMYYVSWDWHIKSPHAGPALEPWLRLSSPWRMSLLFLVSGAATAFMLARWRQSPPAAWLRQRAARLLLPLLLGVLVIVPPQALLEVTQRFSYGGSTLDFMGRYLHLSSGPAFCDARGCLLLPTWNHLWFLPYLLLYTALLWATLQRWPGWLDAAAARLPRLLRGAWLLILPMALFGAARWALRGSFPPTHALVDDVYNHAQYGLAFVLGALLARSGRLWQPLADQRWLALLLALAAWALLLAFGRELPALRPWAFAVQQWGGMAAALGFAQRHLQFDNALRHTLTEAVFPLYQLHQTVIILLAVALAGLMLPAQAEGLLLVLLTFGLCALVYLSVRRVAALRPWFGLGPRDQVPTLSRSPDTPRDQAALP